MLIVQKIIDIFLKLIKSFQKSTKKKISFTFNPHLLPTFRGILSTIYLDINKKSSIKKIRNELIKF